MNEQTETKSEIPAYLFINGNSQVIGTPSYIPSSNKTLDFCFDDFAGNLELQTELGIIFDHVVFQHLGPSSTPEDKETIRWITANYLASFYESSFGYREERRDYLLGNGKVRFLFKDDESLSRVRSIMENNRNSKPTPR